MREVEEREFTAQIKTLELILMKVAHWTPWKYRGYQQCSRVLVGTHEVGRTYWMPDTGQKYCLN